MICHRTLALVAAFFVLSSGYACHAQKTTIDPNADPAPKLDGAESVDVRLAKTITYQAWHIPLNTILEDISKSTGVSLTAGYNKKDWQVRDRRMNVFVKDVTLAGLMNSIARVMKFKWTVNSKVSPPVYRLVADRKLLASLQARASALDKELKAEEVKRRTSVVEALAKVADISGAELQALKESNPYLYQCATTGFAKAMTQVFADEPGLRDAFVNANRTAAVEMSLFGQATQQICADTIRKVWPLDHITQNRAPLRDDLTEDLAKNEIHFDWLTKQREYSQRKRLFYFGAIIGVTSDDYHFLGDLRDPNAKATQAWAKACMDAVDRGDPPAENWSSLAPLYFPVEEEEAKSIEPYLMFDPVVEHPDDGDLHKMITLCVTEEDQKAMRDDVEATEGRAYSRLMYQLVLKTVAEAAGMNVVSDSYAVVLANGVNIPDREELLSILNRTTDIFRTNWEKHGSTLEFRRRDWFRRRSSQLPDEWVKPWRDQLEKSGVLSLDNYTRMMSLTEDQLEENVTCDFLLNQAVGSMYEYGWNRELCRFYLQLSESQRNLILSEQGLEPRSLSPAQWQYYSDMFQTGWKNNWRIEEFLNPNSTDLTIKSAGVPEKGGGATYTFTVRLLRDDGTEKQQNWRIPLRKVAKPSSKASPAK